jgi:Flp pilus assembly pilin Flp
MMPCAASLRRNRSGGAAAEFAIILPMISAMLLGALDFSHAWAMRLELEQAAQAGIEQATARKGVAGDYSFALNEAVARWGGPLVSQTLDTWLECGGVRQANVTASCGAAQRARYVSVRLRAEYMPKMGFGGVITGDGPNGGFVVQGDAAVRVQ